MNTSTLSGYAVLAFLTLVAITVLVIALVARHRERRLVEEFDAALTRVEEELWGYSGLCETCGRPPGLCNARKHTTAGIPLPRKAP